MFKKSILNFKKLLPELYSWQNTTRWSDISQRLKRRSPSNATFYNLYLIWDRNSERSHLLRICYHFTLFLGSLKTISDRIKLKYNSNASPWIVTKPSRHNVWHLISKTRYLPSLDCKNYLEKGVPHTTANGNEGDVVLTCGTVFVWLWQNWRWTKNQVIENKLIKFDTKHWMKFYLKQRFLNSLHCRLCKMGNWILVILRVFTVSEHCLEPRWPVAIKCLIKS